MQLASDDVVATPSARRPTRTVPDRPALVGACRRAVVALGVCLALVGPQAAAAALPATAQPAPAPPATAPAPDGSEPGAVTWALSPASAEGPDGRISLRHVLDPGDSVTDHLTLTNFSGVTRVFDLYAGDGVVSADGDFDLAPSQDAPTAAGTWLVVGEVPTAEPRAGGGVTVTVEPESETTVPVTITVPADARPGDHAAGVVAELVDVSDPSVQLAVRVGVRAHLRVTGDLVARLEPDDVRTRWVGSWNPFAPGELHVEHDVANVGHVRLGAGSTVTATGPLGLGATTGTTDVREVLPGGRTEVATTLRVRPLVRTEVLVQVEPSAVADDDVPAGLDVAVARVGVRTVPWAQLVLLLALVGGVVAGRRWRRRSAERVRRRIDEAVAAATASSRAQEGVADADEGVPARTGG